MSPVDASTIMYIQSVILSSEYLDSLLFTLTFSQMSELQAPPQHITIDLSLNRTQQPAPAGTTTTTTSIDNNATNTDSDTLPAEEGIANEDPKPSTGSAKSTRSSHHSPVMDDSNSSKPEEAQESEAQGSGEKEGMENNSVIEPESMVKDEDIVNDGGEGANGEATNPPEEETVEEVEITETKEEQRPSHEAEEASELETTKDTAVEEVSEELEQEEPSPPDAATGEPETVEAQPTEEGSGGEQGGVDPTTELLDTSVPEEIVVRFSVTLVIHYSNHFYSSVHVSLTTIIL